MIYALLNSFIYSAKKYGPVSAERQVSKEWLVHNYLYWLTAAAAC